ncbi:hypothetical protein ASG01_12585 [Chryseobacterium sp. Leaf180]|nr:hypothetical protein ASG01_12585 [Chryseobacterium sp. Leaf180]
MFNHARMITDVLFIFLYANNSEVNLNLFLKDGGVTVTSSAGRSEVYREDTIIYFISSFYFFFYFHLLLFLFESVNLSEV